MSWKVVISIVLSGCVRGKRGKRCADKSDSHDVKMLLFGVMNHVRCSSGHDVASVPHTS